MQMQCVKKLGRVLAYFASFTNQDPLHVFYMSRNSILVFIATNDVAVARYLEITFLDDEMLIARDSGTRHTSL